MQAVIARIQAGQSLSMDEMSSTIETVMRGGSCDEEIATLLLALRAKGETVDEIAGAAAAMRRQMTPIHTSRRDVIDTCVTGGDGSRTFNISTAAAVVAAAAGVPVAKHGNRGISSRTGSADVLAALGVRIDADVATVERCLDELGLCFCFAPMLHPAMRHVAAARRQLGVPTIFNLLGPLANPADAAFQLIGVGRRDLAAKLAPALARLGSRRAVVVTGSDGLDEVTLAGATHVLEATRGEVKELTWRPADFGLAESGRETLLVDGPEQSAAIIRQVLAGRPGAARDIVVANAAAALWTAGREQSLAGAARLAAEAIDRGAAAELLRRLAEETTRTSA